MKRNSFIKIIILALVLLITFVIWGIIVNYLSLTKCQKFYAMNCVKHICFHERYKDGIKKIYFTYYPEFVTNEKFSKTLQIFKELGYEIEDIREKPFQYPFAYVSDPVGVFPFVIKLSFGYSVGGGGGGGTVYILNLGKYSKEIWHTDYWYQ